MKPIHISIYVPDPRSDVYEFLSVLARHELFTDHMLHGWRCGGPQRGVGSKVYVTAMMGRRCESVEIEVIEDVPFEHIVEQNTSAGGRRIATGTYSLSDAPGAGTRVQFTYAWQSAPLIERLLGVFVRSVMRRGLEVTMQRLAQQLDEQRVNRAQKVASGANT